MIDGGLVAAAAVIGVVVGMTGMGGGALMTPVLVLFFGVPPLTAVSSDLLVSAAMKPVGSIVHIRRRTVHWRIVLWLVVGSVPSAFCGVLLLRLFGPVAGLSDVVKTALGIALLIAATGLIVRAYISLRDWTRQRDGAMPPRAEDDAGIAVRVLPTVLVGVLGGLIVGLTSVGSGSLIIISLMALYPLLSTRGLVGTDLVQAVPLVIAAAVGHLLFGSVDWGVAIPLILGSIPGAFVGAQISSRVSGGVVRRALALILLAAGLKMLGVDNVWTLLAVTAALLAGTGGWMLARVHNGLAATRWLERRRDDDGGAAASAEPGG